METVPGHLSPCNKGSPISNEAALRKTIPPPPKKRKKKITPRVHHTRQKNSRESSFTYEINRLIKPGADIRLVVVLHRDTLVLVVPFEVVGAVGRDVDQRRDPQGIQHVFPGGMVRAAQVEERQDFHGATLKADGQTDNRSAPLGQLPMVVPNTPRAPRGAGTHTSPPLT